MRALAYETAHHATPSEMCRTNIRQRTNDANNCIIINPISRIYINIKVTVMIASAEIPTL
jgi:hypothetical protein